MRKYDVVSIFSGCGGSDLGLKGGFQFLGKTYPSNPVEFVHISDIDKHCVTTLKENFGDVPQIADVTTLELKGIKCDIMVGGFPCQSFSTVNPTKNPEDERGSLYLHMARLLRQVKPAVFIAENVKGLAVLQKGAILQKVIKEFQDCGYNIYYKILNSADYGIPQKRERLFIVGINNKIDIGGFSFPVPTHKDNWVPLKKVIDSLEPPHVKYYFSQNAVDGVKKAKNNMKRALAQDLNEPCLTITSHLAKVSLNSRDPVLLVDPDKELYRRFTPREAARIQSFPDNFIFPVSETQAYKQVGNAIPPLLMWHISQKLLGHLELCQTSSQRKNAVK